MNGKIKLLITLVASIYSFTGCNNQPTTADDKKDSSTLKTSTMGKDSMNKMDNMNMDNGMMASMNSMMGKMNNMKMSGDFDVDFANMMIEHHQGAIDMSTEEIKSGSDDKIKIKAQKIITGQKEEITRLQDIVKNQKPSKMKMGEGELQKSMSGMMNATKSMQMSGNMDKDFVTMMIAHHEGAILMAKEELKQGMNASLKKMAEKIISDQTREISEFKTWQANNK